MDHAPGAGRELDGVGQVVVEHLLQARRVELQVRQVRVDIRDDV
jgi:hypothetical protein